jgi:hypothetical protein
MNNYANMNNSEHNSNKNQSSSIIRTPLQSKVNRVDPVLNKSPINANKSHKCNNEKLAEPKNVEVEKEILKEEDDFTDEPNYNPHKDCISNCFNEFKPKIRLYFSEEESDENILKDAESNIEDVKPISNDIFTYVSMMDVEIMIKLENWVNEGMFYEDIKIEPEN